MTASPPAKSEKQKMLAGELYRAGDPELRADSLRAARWMDAYNAKLARSVPERHALLSELFGSAGEGATIRPPFHCDYGYNIHLGAGAFLNFGCVILDVVRVEIGDLTQIASGVQILTADHPRDAETRRSGLENGRPVLIGRNCWIGAAAVLLPGVTIGDDAIIGAGAIVTRDVAPGQTVAGNPARPIG